jgi:hypothetical protein
MDGECTVICLQGYVWCQGKVDFNAYLYDSGFTSANLRIKYETAKEKLKN